MIYLQKFHEVDSKQENARTNKQGKAILHRTFSIFKLNFFGVLKGEKKFALNADREEEI